MKKVVRIPGIIIIVVILATLTLLPVSAVTPPGTSGNTDDTAVYLFGSNPKKILTSHTSISVDYSNSYGRVDLHIVANREGYILYPLSLGHTERENDNPVTQSGAFGYVITQPYTITIGYSYGAPENVGIFVATWSTSDVTVFNVLSLNYAEIPQIPQINLPVAGFVNPVIWAYLPVVPGEYHIYMTGNGLNLSCTSTVYGLNSGAQSSASSSYDGLIFSAIRSAWLTSSGGSVWTTTSVTGITDNINNINTDTSVISKAFTDSSVISGGQKSKEVLKKLNESFSTVSKVAGEKIKEFSQKAQGAVSDFIKSPGYLKAKDVIKTCLNAIYKWCAAIFGFFMHDEFAFEKITIFVGCVIVLFGVYWLIINRPKE